MKTRAYAPRKPEPPLAIIIASLLTRLLLAAQTITRFSYGLLSVFIFFACQQNLTQTNTFTDVARIAPLPDSSLITERFIPIDTTQYCMAEHASTLSEQHQALHKRIQDKAQRLYIANDLKTKWLEEGEPNKLYFAFIDQLKNAFRYGLNPDDYDIEGIEKGIRFIYESPSTASVNDLITLDLHITETFFLFATHLRDGRMTSKLSHQKNLWIREAKQEKHTDASMLAQAKTPQQLNETISHQQPAHEQYTKLLNALDYFHSLEQSASFSPITTAKSSDKIKPKDRHTAIPLIRKRLSLTQAINYLIAEDSITCQPDTLLYDEGLVSAVKAFQKTHGLDTNGIINDKTLKFLNQSFSEKANLIALNMERIRWLPETLEDRYIAVNIPEYKLRIYEKQAPALEMKVIVGSVSTPSPVFNDSLELIVFSPTWSVPASIMKTEIFPKLVEDPLHYKDFTFYKNGVEIDPSTERWDSIFNVKQYRIIQKPGRSNALGMAKFVLSNRMNIYLHDTPDHSSFSKNYRALSHGCIRVDNPTELAEYLLQDYVGWDRKKIHKTMKSAEPVTLSLKKKYYQVHLEYNTVWVDENGDIQFREDIYGHDKKQLQQLFPAKKNVPSVAAL